MDPRRHAGGRRRHGRPLPLAALAIGAWLLPSCVGPGLASRHRSLEAEWRASAAPAPSADDPFPGHAWLDRDALVAEVLRRNPSLRAARHAWRAALARYPQETSLDDPMLGYGVGPASLGSRQVHDAHRVDLSQKFPFPGKLALRGEVALAEAEAAARDFEAARLRLGTMASLLFDEYYLADRSLEINAQHLALLEEFRRIATTRYEAGEVTQQAPLQAEVEHAHLLRRDVVLRTARRVTAEQINTLLHQRPDRALPPPPPRLAPPDDGDPDPAERRERALREHPELRAAAARVRAREADVALARREYLPDFTLLGAYEGLMPERDLRPVVGLSIEVPLRLARRRAAVEEARATLERARSEQASAEDEIGLAVESGLDRLEEARQVLRLYRDRLLPAARDQVEAARAGFESGRNSFLELIDAERSLRDVELGYEESLADVSRRTAELQRATGIVPGGPGGGVTP